jgi:hypothetical protein
MAERMICMNVTYVCPLIQKANKNIKEKKRLSSGGMKTMMHSLVFSYGWMIT